ncbi:MAG: flavin reductase family protein [Thermodesulfobacteriota bacterium]
MDVQIAQALRLIPYGIYLLITGPREKEKAMIVSWVTQVSYSPPLIAAVLRYNRSVLKLLQEGSLLSLNLLKNEHKPFIPILKSSSSLNLAGFNFQRGMANVLYLPDALAYWFCEVHSLISMGDHMLVVNKIKAAQATAGIPLTTLDYGKTYLGQE